MRLHEDKTLFRQAVTATAEQLHIPEIFIEKDYRVTCALHAIFHDPIGGETVFKGGTALSKCFGLIERFSEDIDLVVKRRGGETDNQLKRKIKRIGQVVTPVLPEIEVEGLTRKMGMNRKTAHNYPQVFDGRFGQVRDVIVVEATWYGYYEPYVEQSLSAYIHDMMVEQEQQEMIEEFGLQPFQVNVLHVNRTLCEKIMGLVRFSYSETPMDDLRMKIRHVYDLHKMLEDQGLSNFFDSDDFAAFILKVAEDDVQSFRNNNEWLTHHPADALLFRDVEGCWSGLKATYTGEFRGLVYGELPKEQQIVATLIRIQERLRRLEWNISE
ncbi:MAG: nucleotidyl transferase AbiEii/AbiGii toxin family protein [Deltaproteobacteria bacterium]|nr:nucleotidyl transferase AbiEii/AbiGii toxin family protein [Deltaproteobacteria bacterium]